jgi:hypothetical protein
VSIDRVPDLLPVLSRGKHRSPRRGACFMELASYLAGERWSDHPACTHPLLAELIPSVIGLTSDDPRVDVRLTLRAAAESLPIAAADRQRVMAVAVLTCQRVLAELDGEPPTGPLIERGQRALAQAPHAASWARRYTGGNTIPLRAFRRHAAPSAVRYAVEGIGRACVPDPDRRLHDLLAAAIEDTRDSLRAEAPPTAEPAAWAAACRLTGATA